MPESEPSPAPATTRAERVKLYCEIAAFGFAALFLVGKVANGYFNHGMEVGIELERVPSARDTTRDDLAITVKLKRPDAGRIEISDVYIEVSDVTDSTSAPRIIRKPSITTEHQTQVDGDSARVKSGLQRRGTLLPPGDGTQLAYFARVREGEPVLVDVTILGRRTGFSRWLGRPQWRGSAISLPEAPSEAEKPAR